MAIREQHKGQEEGKPDFARKKLSNAGIRKGKILW